MESAAFAPVLASFLMLCCCALLFLIAPLINKLMHGVK